MLFKKREGNPFSELPDGLFVKCPACKQLVLSKEYINNLWICPKCGHHKRLTAKERLGITLDPGSFVEMDSTLRSIDPLGFPDYSGKLTRDVQKTGLLDPIVTGTGNIHGVRIAIGVADFTFMGGSMGSVSGEKIVRLMESGLQNNLPVILFTASGGARMQEGLISLMQMPKTCAARARLIAVNIPYIVVFTDPTMAGVLASFASVADFTFAEPHAKVGFAGDRVSQQAQSNTNTPNNFQSSEFSLEHGMIDGVVSRKDMVKTISDILSFCHYSGGRL